MNTPVPLVFIGACAVAVMTGCGSAADNGKALHITEVLCESSPGQGGLPGSKEMRRKITVRVANRSSLSTVLNIGESSPKPVSEESVQFERELRSDMGMSGRPYKLGLEVGWHAKGEWPQIALGLSGWTPVERPEERVNNNWEFEIRPGESRSFYCEAKSNFNGSWDGDAYRAYLLSPDSQRVDEQICVP